MFEKILLLCILGFSVCKCELEDIITPCDKNDTQCLLNTFNDILQYLCDNGAPECGIDPIDPFDLEGENYHVSLFEGGLNLTVDNGYLKGIKGCKYTFLRMDLDAGVGIVKVKCEKDLVIDGDYHFSTIDTPLDPVLGGNLLHGDGKAHITVNQLAIAFPFTVKLVEGEDGLKHLQFKKDFTYSLDSLTFHVTEVKAGDIDITDEANEIIQKNYKALLLLVGRQFVGAAVKIYREKSDLVFNCIPASDFINLS